MSRTRTAQRARCLALERGVCPVSPTYPLRETVSVPGSLAGTRFGVGAGVSRLSGTLQSQSWFLRGTVEAHANRTRGGELTAHENLRPFWALVWRVYDRPVLVRVMPSRVAPWLFGRMIGAKGRRAPL